MSLRQLRGGRDGAMCRDGRRRRRLRVPAHQRGPALQADPLSVAGGDRLDPRPHRLDPSLHRCPSGLESGQGRSVVPGGDGRRRGRQRRRRPPGPRVAHFGRVRCRCDQAGQAPGPDAGAGGGRGTGEGGHDLLRQDRHVDRGPAPASVGRASGRPGWAPIG